MPDTSGKQRRRIVSVVLTALVLAGSVTLYGKRKEAEGEDVTTPFFQLLDESYGGKLDSCVLGDVYTDSASGQEYRHVVRVDYDKSRGFGKLNLYVRGVAKMTPEQLSAYTPQQVFDFGEIDLEKFIKTSSGPFGQPGDLYLRSTNGGPLTQSPITDEVRKEYDTLITQCLLPALQKDHKTP